MDDSEYHWSDHVRMLAYAVFLLAMVFVGPLAAIFGLAVVLFALPDGESRDVEATVAA